MLGNFPQAFSHVALITTALGLMMQEQKRGKKIRKAIVRDQANLGNLRGWHRAEGSGDRTRRQISGASPAHRDAASLHAQEIDFGADGSGEGFHGVRPYFHRISGYVRNGVVFTAPHLGTKSWAGFKLADAMEKKLGRPVRLRNDADIQGLAAIKGKGLELVCTLGTGFGTAWFRDGELMPHMDLAHMAIHPKHDFDDYIGDHTLNKIGPKEWNKRIMKTVETLNRVFFYDHLYLGGGNARLLKIKLPGNVSVVSNDAGMEGGAFVWLPKGPKNRG